MTAETTRTDPGRDRSPLTPDRVYNQEFSLTRLGHRGYDEDEVHAFLYRVAEDITASDAEKATLRAEIDRLKRWYAKQDGVDVDDPNSTSQRGRLSVDAINLLSRAQQTADAQIAQAESYARQLVTDARHQHEAILAEAHQRAQQAANQAAIAYRAGPGVHSTDAEELERRIAYLRTFADVTQVQLRAVFEGLAREMDRLADTPQTGVVRLS